MCWPNTLVIVLADVTVLQVFEDSADDGDTAFAGEQRALARLAQVAEDARDYASRAKAPNTLKAYRIDWTDFSEWCALHRLEFLPAAPQTVALYLSNLARTHRVSTLYRRLSGISQAHQAAGFATPTRDPQVRLVFQGIRRTLGAAPDQKNAAITAEVRAMVETLSPTSLLGVRDRALLLVGFAGAFRRSELVSLDVADVSLTATAWSSRCAGGKPTRKASGERSGCRSGRIRSPARCAPCAPGSTSPSSPAARFSRRRSPRERGRRQAHRSVRGAGGETLREGGRAGLGTIRRALAAIGTGHRGGDGGCVGASDHGPDRAQVTPNGQTLHQRWFAVQKQRRRCGWAVNRMAFRRGTARVT
jgi:integrase